MAFRRTEWDHRRRGSWPAKLAGQYREYLKKALEDYQSGLRKDAIMAGFAKALTKQDIDNLAAYYAAQPAVLSAKY